MTSVAATEHNLQHRIDSYETTRQRAIEFLIRHVNEDGSIGPRVERVTYYRVPWALMLGGETQAAYRLLSWIEHTGFGSDGEFHGGARWSSAVNPVLNTYPETCLAYGAHLLRRFDIAQRAIRFALSFQDPETGGIYMDRERTGTDGPQLVFPTCQFGMSALVTGHVDAAILAGSWLQRLWEAQPELPDRLYTVWSRSGGLATTPLTGDDPRHYINESQEIRQLHYNGGIAAAFLNHLFMRTADNEWLALAREFQAFSMNSTERQFETKQVCKSAWGAGLLAISTGDSLYVDWVVRMGDWFAAEQQADGHWDNTAYLDPTSPIQHQIEATAEFIVHLDTIIGALASHIGR